MGFIESHWYKFNDKGKTHIGYFLGRQKRFDCPVCGKVVYVYAFNVWSYNMGFLTMNV